MGILCFNVLFYEALSILLMAIPALDGLLMAIVPIPVINHTSNEHH